MKAPKDGVTRTGDFSATGEYKWYAFAEEPGPIQRKRGYEVLDTRKKVTTFFLKFVVRCDSHISSIRRVKFLASALRIYTAL